MKIYWHYATITIPAHTVIARTADFSETRLVVPVSVRAKRHVTKSDAPLPKSVWVFGYGYYTYMLPLDTPGLIITNERSAVGRNI